MAVQLNPNVVNNISQVDAARALEDAPKAGAIAPVDTPQVQADYAVRVEDDAAAVKAEIKADARKDVRTFRGIGAARDQQPVPAGEQENLAAPPSSDQARVEAQVAADVGGQKVAVANSPNGGAAPVANAENGDTGKAVEASGSSDAGAD